MHALRSKSRFFPFFCFLADFGRSQAAKRLIAEVLLWQICFDGSVRSFSQSGLATVEVREELCRPTIRRRFA